MLLYRYGDVDILWIEVLVSDGLVSSRALTTLAFAYQETAVPIPNAFHGLTIQSLLGISIVSMASAFASHAQG